MELTLPAGFVISVAFGVYVGVDLSPPIGAALFAFLAIVLGGISKLDDHTRRHTSEELKRVFTLVPVRGFLRNLVIATGDNATLMRHVMEKDFSDDAYETLFLVEMCLGDKKKDNSP